VTQLGRALVDLHGSKSLPAFARDVYYIGRNYEVTGPKGRLSWRRRRRHRRRRIVQVAPGGEGTITGTLAIGGMDAVVLHVGPSSDSLGLIRK
jgi:hypothetical protein